MRNKAQSTLEYIIVFTAIVVAVLALASGALKPAVQNILNGSATKINNAAIDFVADTE